MEGITVAARGNAEAVPALEAHLGRGDVVMHNHPGGRLEPSNAGLRRGLPAGRPGDRLLHRGQRRCPGCTSWPSPSSARPLAPLDPGRLSGLLRPRGRPGGHLSGVRGAAEPGADAASSWPRVQPRRDPRRGGGHRGRQVPGLPRPRRPWALENGERVVVSTATINLQQQLVEKDIPLGSGCSGATRVVPGEGPGQLPVPHAPEGSPGGDRALRGAEHRAGRHPRVGPRPRRPGPGRTSPPIPTTSCGPGCAPRRTPATGCAAANREGCFVLKARREAASARVLVANHHLLFADLRLRLAGHRVRCGRGAAPVPAHHLRRSPQHREDCHLVLLRRVQPLPGGQVRRAGCTGRRRGQRHGLLLGLERVSREHGRRAAPGRQGVVDAGRTSWRSPRRGPCWPGQAVAFGRRGKRRPAPARPGRAGRASSRPSWRACSTRLAGETRRGGGGQLLRVRLPYPAPAPLRGGGHRAALPRQRRHLGRSVLVEVGRQDRSDPAVPCAFSSPRCPSPP